jgi:GNAT superfamily N-acetyltransferase
MELTQLDPERSCSRWPGPIVPFKRRHLDGAFRLFAAEGWDYGDRQLTLRALTASGSICLVALGDGGVIGVAQVLSNGIQAFLPVLLVSEQVRRHGVGRALLQAALQRAGTRGLELLTTNAELFYESLGAQRRPGFRLERVQLGLRPF